MIIAMPSTSPSTGSPRVDPHDQRRQRRPSTRPLPMPTSDFLQQRLARVAPGQLAQRDAADDHRQRLRRGVAAHAGHDRHEDRERPATLDRALEQADDRRGQKRGRQVDAEPRQPLAQRLPRRREHALVAGHAGQPIDVFGRLVLDDVDDVIDGDDADQLVLLVDDRNRQQVVGRRPAAPLPPGPCRRGR